MRFEFPGKTGQALLFKRLGVPHPRSVVWPSVAFFREFLTGTDRLPHGMPYMIKADRSHEGEGVFLIENQDILEKSLNRLSQKEYSGEKGFVTQDFIQGGGNVLRAVVLGHRIFTYWKRPVQSGQIITTVSRGARIDKTWRRDLQVEGGRRSLAFSKQTGVNLAAIDFVCSLSDMQPELLFLEVNYYFGRRGLGGSEDYYHILHDAVREWLLGKGLDPSPVMLV
jgi:ribosomal protein S6--L-glutamate ligase